MSEASVPSRILELRIEEMIDLYETRLLRMCFLYLHDQSLAEDAVQETFIKAYKTLTTFRNESDVGTWLTRIAVNTCKDIKRGSWFRRVDRAITLDTLPEPIYEQNNEDDSIVLEVMRLPERLRLVILLYYYQNIPVVEIGQILSISASTVYHRLKVAQQKLEKKLEGWCFYE